MTTRLGLRSLCWLKPQALFTTLHYKPPYQHGNFFTRRKKDCHFEKPMTRRKATRRKKYCHFEKPMTRRKAKGKALLVIAAAQNFANARALWTKFIACALHDGSEHDGWQNSLTEVLW